MALGECNQENRDCRSLYRTNGLISLKITYKGKKGMEEKYNRLINNAWKIINQLDLDSSKQTV